MVTFFVEISRCCACCTKAAEEECVMGDNCCLCNMAALRKFTEFTDTEILYASFQDEVSNIQYLFVSIIAL